MQDGAIDSGVEHGEVLVAFTDAVMARDAEAIERTREQLRGRLGDEGVVDASAVILMFNVVDRIADSTGIPTFGWGRASLKQAPRLSPSIYHICD